MLLQFTFENHRSFRDPATLSFVATSRKDEPAWCIESRYAAHGVLPVVGVWGANASGKSNLIDALRFAHSAVRDSHVRWTPTQRVPQSPWARRTGTPSRFELDMEIHGARYAYGFTIQDGAFVAEHLFRWEGARKQVLYTRDAQKTPAFYFGPAVKRGRARIAESTRTNSLFLSAAAQANHPQFLPVYLEIVGKVRPAMDLWVLGQPLFEEGHPILEPQNRSVLVNLLRAADVGISDLEVLGHDPIGGLAEGPGPALYTPDAIALLKQRSKSLRTIRLKHGVADPWLLDPDEESRGTQVLLDRLADILPTLHGGGILIADEIDTSLHPDLCANLVALFTNPESNRHGAQLLFSTHDRGLLEHLRTDEVALVDKTSEGVSSLAAASDYAGVRTRDSLRRAHAQGRIRGVPVLGDFVRLLNKDSDPDGTRS